MFAPSFFEHLEDRLNLAVYDTKQELQQRRLTALLHELDQEYRMATSPIISRLKDKLGKAAGVAQRAAASIEAEADALIAEEDAIKAKTSEAFSPHHAILAEAGTELQAIKDALNIMSNGGPALDPLDGQKNTAPASPLAFAPLNEAGVVPEKK